LQAARISYFSRSPVVGKIRLITSSVFGSLLHQYLLQARMNFSPENIALDYTLNAMSAISAGALGADDDDEGASMQSRAGIGS
jgi:hypothetical protein